MAYVINYIYYLYIFRFKYNDPALRNLIDSMDELNDVFGKGVPADLFPVLKHLPLYSHRTIRKCGKIFANLTEEIYEEHKQNFDEGESYVFC